MSVSLLYTGSRSDPHFAMAHGAGAPMDTPFMNTIAKGVAKRGYCVVRFEFAYMQKRRADGKKRSPDRQEKLLEAWREVIEQLPRPFAIGGKSMGGRMASLLADDVEAAALICLGYPFHPAGKPDQLRTDHLAQLKTPSLILQGERDALGSKDEVDSYKLSKAIRCVWLPDGDHSLKPRKKSGHTEEQNLQAAVEAAAEFLQRTITQQG